MSIDTSSPRTRRAILAGGLGGLAALAAHALGRPRSALASDGQTMLVGGEYSSTSVTAVTNATGNGFYGGSLGTGIAVTGQGNQGIGVHGFSTAEIGVLGETDSSSWAAVTGRSFGGGTGVLGSADNAPVPAAKAKTGVYGQATQDGTSRGVWGYSPAGYGVLGEATTGRGVQGTAWSGVGVRAAATNGTGIWASATTGYAVQADGRILFNKSAGLATIASGTSSVSVTPGIDLTATSAVIATLNGNAGGSTAVKRVAVNATTNVFTIYLTANSTASVKVAWLVLG
jgi:hypothetical protein